MASIDFIHAGAPYSGETLRSASMGGTESSVVQLAEALAQRGHVVSVFNGVASPVVEYGVNWRPLSDAADFNRGDVGIAVASPKPFLALKFRRPIVWLHNPTKSWRQIKRGNVLALAKARPHLVVLGDHHRRHIPQWLPFRSRHVIEHGVHPDFFRHVPSGAAPPPQAIFTSQPYRGLDWLLELWGEVKKQAPEATFKIFAPKAHQAAQNAARSGLTGVSFGGSVSRAELIGELGKSRVQLIPGHHDETYCLAAAEATAAGVPIVSRGFGALTERVRPGKTGFIAAHREDFIARTVSLLSGAEVWKALHDGCIEERSLAGWDKRAEEWESLFQEIGAR